MNKIKKVDETDAILYLKCASYKCKSKEKIKVKIPFSLVRVLKKIGWAYNQKDLHFYCDECKNKEIYWERLNEKS